MTPLSWLIVLCWAALVLLGGVLAWFVGREITLEASDDHDSRTG